MLNKIFSLFKKNLSFKEYITRHCGMSCCVKHPDFPVMANYRDLKYFINKNNLPPEIGNCLEELHDNYHLNKGRV